MKFRLHKIRRFIRIPFPMVLLLFLCNFSWAAEHQPCHDKFSKAGLENHADRSPVLTNVPSICLLLNTIIENQIPETSFPEYLLEDINQNNNLTRTSFELKKNISAASIAINAP